MSCTEIDRRTCILDSVIDAVGQTPCIRMTRFAKAAGVPEGVEIIGKCEYLNPGGSVKDRIGRLMVLDAERDKKIKAGDTLVIASSGNAAGAIAMAGAARGYKTVVTMPTKMSQEKQLALQTMGAQVIRTPTSVAFDHPDSLISVANKIVKENPDTHVYMDQYAMPGNPNSHEFGTGAEIVQQCGGKVDAVFVGTGTGGTITGVARALKKGCTSTDGSKKCEVVGVDPLGSILADPDSPAPKVSYHVEGIGYDFVPDVLDRSLVDTWMKSEDPDSFELARLCHRTEGLLVGGSSGSMLAAAVKRAKALPAGTKARYVVVLPDSIRNYMSKFVDDNWMKEKGFLPGEVERPTYDALAEENRKLKEKLAQLEGAGAAAAAASGKKEDA